METVLLLNGKEYMNDEMEAEAVKQFGRPLNGRNPLRYCRFNLEGLNHHLWDDGQARVVLAFTLPSELIEEMTQTALTAGTAGWSRHTAAVHVWDPMIPSWVAVGRCRL